MGGAPGERPPKAAGLAGELCWASGGVHLIDWPSTGLALHALAKDARTLALAGFEARYARAFFICHRSPSTVPKAPMRTRAAASVEGGTGELVIVTYPVRRRPESDLAFIGIGRLDGNDIAIFDDTLSKFHAYVKEGPERTFTIQDGKSRNGTTVDDVAVAPRGAGPPTILKSGQRVRFGSVTTTFLDATAVVALAARLTRST